MLRAAGTGFAMDSVHPANFDRPWAPRQVRGSATTSDDASGAAASPAVPRDATPRVEDLEAGE